jgi:polyisoprenoid-binding protein YceI
MTARYREQVAGAVPHGRPGLAEVELEVEYEGAARSPFGTDIFGFSASTEIDREDFGLTWNAVLETGGVAVGRKIKIEIEGEAVRQ